MNKVEKNSAAPPLFPSGGGQGLPSHVWSSDAWGDLNGVS